MRISLNPLVTVSLQYSQNNLSASFSTATRSIFIDKLQLQVHHYSDYILPAASISQSSYHLMLSNTDPFRVPYTLAASVPTLMASLFIIKMATHTNRSKVKPKLTYERSALISPPATDNTHTHTPCATDTHIL